MNQSQVAKTNNKMEGTSMSMEQIKLAARQMMAQHEFKQRADFYGHWLTRLGLDPVVTRLEKAHAAKAKLKAAKRR